MDHPNCVRRWSLCRRKSGRYFKNLDPSPIRVCCSRRTAGHYSRVSVVCEWAVEHHIRTSVCGMSMNFVGLSVFHAVQGSETCPVKPAIFLVLYTGNLWVHSGGCIGSLSFVLALPFPKVFMKRFDLFCWMNRLLSYISDRFSSDVQFVTVQSTFRVYKGESASTEKTFPSFRGIFTRKPAKIFVRYIEDSTDVVLGNMAFPLKTRVVALARFHSCAILLGHLNVNVGCIVLVN